MSGYQYYEFQAIDRPLTENQKADMFALSSRANVTSRTASFVYHYGDFRGDVKTLMSDYFDAMLYMANWGSRHLMFRIPCSLLDMEEAGKYCISREISIKKTKDLKNVIVDFDFYDENHSGWIETGEGWLDELVGLRDDLIQGDYRVLYLAWLKAAEMTFDPKDIDTDILEPPIPPGLRNLSAELKTFIEFLDIDEDIIEAAAQKSENMSKSQNLETWIDRLPSSEQHDFLVRLSRGESNLSVLLNRRLRELADEAQPQKKEIKTHGRTISAFIESAELRRQERIENERREAELARQRELEALIPKKHQLREEVERLIKEKKTKSYDEAVALLKQLRDVAEYQGEPEVFKNHIARIRQTYSNLHGLLRRLQNANLNG